MRSPFSYFKSTQSAILLILLISGFLLSFIVLLHIFGGIAFAELTRDPIAFLEGSVYTGILSQIGILIWAAISSICIFSSYSLPKDIKNRNIKQFFLASGLLTFILGIDDAFLLHEESSKYLGFSEKIIFLFYIFCICIYIFRFYSFIATSEYSILGLAFFCFGISILLDVLEPPNINPYIFEDGAKLIGIISFLVYYFRLGMTSIHAIHSQKRSSY